MPSDPTPGPRDHRGHWASEHFETYDPATNGEALERALSEHDRRSLGETSTISFANLDVRPYPHQERMLETLQIERDRHERHRNLVVAATGTGKTVVAALDYRRLSEEAGRNLSLLFLAHRETILRQALATFRHVMRSGEFGEIHGGGKIASGQHVFGMINSLHAKTIEQLDPEAFDVVIVDEFHHAAAPTYDRLLSHLRPTDLLGLTATPERRVGKDVTTWFDGRIAVELRLWEAIDQGPIPQARDPLIACGRIQPGPLLAINAALPRASGRSVDGGFQRSSGCRH